MKNLQKKDWHVVERNWWSGDDKGGRRLSGLDYHQNGNAGYDLPFVDWLPR